MSRILFAGLTFRAVLLVAFEAALICAAVALAAFLRLGGGWWEGMGPTQATLKGLLVAFAVQVCMYYNDLYDLRAVRDRRELIVRILQALGAASLLLGLSYFFFPDLIIGRGVFLIATVLVGGFVVGWRLLFDLMARNVGPRERLLLVGTNQAAVTLARELYERPELAVKFVGFIDPDPARLGESVLNPGIVGAVEDIPRVVAEQKVDRVVLSLADARGKLPMDRLLEMKLAGVTFDHLASVYEEYTGKIAVENLRPSWLIFSEGFRKSRAKRAFKRAFDLGFAAVLAVVLVPVMAIVALLVKLTSAGPAIYSQQRVGEHNHVFTIYKFRSMRQDAEKFTGAVWAQKDDPRITWFGRIMRRTRLDELPQLWNVVNGDMSFVGPRPERPEFVARLTEEIPFYGLRHTVKPGLTGWAQVKYTYGASVEDALEKLQYDLFYIKHLSLSLDLYVIFETIKTVVLRRGA
jgi:sugar transferase (PEP-CTERM system associated)